MLTRLFDCPPPDHWFSDNEFFPLYKSLQCLTGYHSCARGGQADYNLCLLNLPVLLGIACGQKKIPKEQLLPLLEQISFYDFRKNLGCEARRQILPPQSPEASRDSVRRLVKSLKLLVAHRDNDQFTVRRALLKPSTFAIEFSFGADHVRKFIASGASEKNDMFSWVNTVLGKQDYPLGHLALTPQMWIDVHPCEAVDSVCVRFCVRPSLF
jgi:hypothetical protein